MRGWVAAVGLVLHPTKTRIVDASQRGGFDFLGYHFERGYRWPRQKSMDKFKDAIRVKTRRNRPDSMADIVREVNPALRGCMGYFQHSISNIFPELDSWIRGRLRSILRKRRKRKGHARGSDHPTWPNAYFADLGLISLASTREAAAAAQVRACQLESRMRYVVDLVMWCRGSKGPDSLGFPHSPHHMTFSK